MLGTIDQGAALKLLRGLAAADASGLLATVAELDEMVPDYGAALDELALLIQRTALAQVAESVLEDLGAAADDVRELAASMAAEDLQLYYQIALIGKRDLHLAPSARAGFEMILLRMLAFRPAETGGTQSTVAPCAPVAASGSGTARRASPPSPRPAKAPPGRGGSRETTGAGADSGADSPESWEATIKRLKLAGAVRQLANHCQIRGIDGGVISFVLDEAAAHLQTDALQEKFRQALCDGLGRQVRIRIELGQPDVETPAQKMSRQDVERQQAAVVSIDEDPNVLAIQKAFDATVDPASIKPASH